MDRSSDYRGSKAHQHKSSPSGRPSIWADLYGLLIGDRLAYWRWKRAVRRSIP